MNALVDHKAFATAAPAAADVFLFDFNDHQIRVLKVGGEPWFVAADVCRVLSMDIASRGTYPYLRGLDAAEKKMMDRAESPDLFSGYRGGALTVIAESGLYKLLLRSNKPEAKPFQDRVTKEVLPTIRKDGAYIVGEEKVPKT